MNVYENVMNSGTNKAGIGVKIVDFRHFASLFRNIHYNAEVN